MKTSPVSGPAHFSPGVTQRRIRRWEGGGKAHAITDSVVVEEPLEIRIDTHPVSVTMRTPGQDQELAAGFLISEGIVRKPEDIAFIRADPRNPDGNVLNVFLASHCQVDLARLTRHVFASSSCGLCGKATILAVHQHFKPIRAKVRIHRSLLLSLPEQLRQAQVEFDRTGGLHAAAIFDRTGKLIVVREDVGRHNAVDKVIGFGLLQGRFPFETHVLMVSGRASFEIMQKALAARVPVVAAVSAPSSLAVDFARENKQTLVGFLRGDKMNIYAGFTRVVT